MLIDRSFAKRAFKTIATLSITIMCGCSEPDSTIECGCESSKYVTLASEPGVMVNTLDGYLVLTPNFGYITWCDQTDQSIWIDGLNVKITGKLKKMCDMTGSDRWYVVNHLSSSTLMPSTDSLFSSAPVEIHIIKSEDYGYSPGYGYRMTKTSVDGGAFKVFQPTIPAVGENKTFKKSLDAFKVAVLVAHKSTVDVYDLQYLRTYP